jgi:D-inositol-3-phosphate glycosyltransferase
LEAMACGTPVIGSNVGGIKYSVKDGETGFLIPPKDPFALAEKIENLVMNQALLNTMKRNAVKRVNKYFTWASVADSVNCLYEQLMSKQTKHTGKIILLPELNLRGVENILQDTFLPRLKTQ